MNYLAKTFFYDYEQESIQRYIKELAFEQLSQKEKIVKLYYQIRDGWWYNPYGMNFQKERFKSSRLIYQKDGNCLDKCILYISCLRALGIPARIHLAKVSNHIAVEKLVEKIGTNELTPHGMVDIFINGKWIKSSPAFNKELCERYHVAPLDFDGESDSVFQEYNREGKAFMDYLEDYGSFEDFPYDFVIQNMKEHYGQFFKKENSIKKNTE